jgi:hypothetical protein
MPTYEGNAYAILSQVRYGIGEFSTAYVQGTDATGSFKNEELIRRINNAQNYIWSILFGQFSEYFLINDDITFTGGVATLPSDCFKVRELLNSNGFALQQVPLWDRLRDGRYYFRYANKVKICSSDMPSGTFETDPLGGLTPATETGSIWYYSKCRDLDTGVTSAGGAKSATLATTAKAIADYYNGMSIENVTDSTVDVISDYAATRVATVANTWAVSKYYGIVSELPDIFQPLIAEYAILQIKQDPKTPLQVVPANVSLFGEMLREAMKSFAGTYNGDTDINDIINDFER